MEKIFSYGYYEWLNIHYCTFHLFQNSVQTRECDSTFLLDVWCLNFDVARWYTYAAIRNGMKDSPVKKKLSSKRKEKKEKQFN